MSAPSPTLPTLPSLPTAERRDEVRRRCLERGGFYNPWLHLGVTSLFGGGLVVAGLWVLEDLTLWEVGVGLALLVLANAAEWRIHKSLLHHRFPLAPVLYDRHTPEHHVIYVTDDMEIRSARELRLVLIPAYGIVALFAGLLPGIAMIWLGWPFAVADPVAQHNLAAIFTIVTMGYVVSYEWLHLTWHLPEKSFIGRLALVRKLKRHHALHHDPRNMQRWNFNVTVPLWDLVRRTRLR